MDGGVGNDLLIVDYSSNTHQGTVRTPGISTSLSSNGSGGFNGNYYANRSDSSGDADQIIFSNIERFQITGTIANDSIMTGDGNDTINGGAGDDNLTGGVGNDNLVGGPSDDTYIVDSGDVVVELANEGTEYVYAYGNYSLTANVEHLILSGSATNGTGNDLGNYIVGNANIGSTLSGLVGNDNLIGGAGNDTLTGGTGSDYLVGGAGNDTYNVDSTDVVAEVANEGNDFIYTSSDYTLMTNVENLILVGSAASGTGNDSANHIAGNSTLASNLSGLGGNDTLVGGAGNDTLSGGSGNDSLVGGAGDDAYNVDTSDVVS